MTRQCRRVEHGTKVAKLARGYADSLKEDPKEPLRLRIIVQTAVGRRPARRQLEFAALGVCHQASLVMEGRGERMGASL